MASARESVLLPTIKCSQCGAQVEISMMGEHICKPADVTAQLSPPPEEEDIDPFQKPGPPTKVTRKPLPLNTGIANESFMRPGLLTPVSDPRDSVETDFANTNIESNNGHLDSSSLNVSGARTPMAFGWGFGQKDGYTTEPIPSPGVASLGFLERMNTIAPGPFDTGRRPSLFDSSSLPRKDSITIDTSGHLREHSENQHRPGTAPVAPEPLLKTPAQNAHESFVSSDSDSDLEPPRLSTMIRSATFPKNSMPIEPPTRTPSAPGTRQSEASEYTDRVISMGPDTSRRPPPRKSLIKPASLNVGSVDLAAEFGIHNPYHTPSDSTSSGYSGFSHPSYPSSRTSAAGSHSRRQPSNMSNQSGWVDEHPISISSSDHLRPKDIRVDSHAPPRTQTPNTDSPYGLSPKDNASPLSQNYRYDDPDTGFPNRQTSTPRFDGPLQPEPEIPSLAAPRTPRWDNASTDRVATSPLSQQGARSPGGSLPYRGDCKACGLAIRGKSVSSADGRLTGKYHKPCFVCTTCSEPFTSAEFYVHDDRPYCEQHYHKLNGSLCGSCGRGIEGHYIEDESRIKYHTGCFCCVDCGQPLSDGYFEIGGKQYCERDAVRRPPPRSNPPPFAPGLPAGLNPFANQPRRPGPGPPRSQPTLPPKTNFNSYGSAYSAYGSAYSDGMLGSGSAGPGYGPSGGRQYSGYTPPHLSKRTTKLGLMP